MLHALEAAGRLGEPGRLGVEAAHGLGDLGEVADPVTGDDLADRRGVADVDDGQHALLERQPGLGQAGAQVLVERGDAVVVEGRGAGAEDRHVLGPLAERSAVADQLATHVAQRVHRAAALELVDRDGVGEVEHVDLLQLRRGAELRRHHVERGVDVGDDARVALPDAGGLDDDEVEAAGLHDVDHVGEVLGDLVGATGRERAEEDPVAVEGVGADPVAEQRAAAATAGRVDREDRDPQLVLLVEPEAAYELVGQRRLAGAAGTGDAEDRGGVGGRGVSQPGEHVGGQPALLGAGDRAGDGGALAGEHGVRAGLPLLPQVEVAVLDDGVDHPDEAHLLAVLGREDGDAGLAQPGDLLRHDHAATAPDDPYVAGARGAERLHEVLEVLHVAALVRRHRDALHVLLERGVHDLLHRAVVAEVDDLAALALEDPPHDVDRGVVAVEEGRGRHQPDRVLRHVQVGL